MYDTRLNSYIKNKTENQGFSIQYNSLKAQLNISPDPYTDNVPCQMLMQLVLHVLVMVENAEITVKHVVMVKEV